MDMQPIVHHALARRTLIHRRCLVPNPGRFAGAAEITGQDRHGIRASMKTHAVRGPDQGWETSQALLIPWQAMLFFL